MVLDDRAAGSHAELILVQRGDGLVGFQEEIARIEGIVADELPGSAVEIVRAGLGHHVDHRAAARAEFGGVLADLDAELLHGIDTGRQVVAVEECFLVIGAVELVVVFRGRHAGGRSDSRGNKGCL